MSVTSVHGVQSECILWGCIVDKYTSCYILFYFIMQIQVRQVTGEISAISVYQCGHSAEEGSNSGRGESPSTYGDGGSTHHNNVHRRERKTTHGRLRQTTW